MNDPFESNTKTERQTLSRIRNGYEANSDEFRSLELAAFALLETFAHDTEEEFLWNHYNQTPQKPKDGTTIEEVKQFWLSHRLVDGKVPLTTHRYSTKDSPSIDIHLHCKILSKVASQYDPQTLEYRSIELGARALIHFYVLGYAQELLAMREQIESDNELYDDEEFKRLWLKKMKRMPPGMI